MRVAEREPREASAGRRNQETIPAACTLLSSARRGTDAPPVSPAHPH